MYHLVFCLLLSLFTFQVSASSYKYELSACAIFQDEGPYLREWIEYHRMLGVQHFYLYNNNSTDNFRDVLSPYIKKNVVEIIEWPSQPNTNFDPIQMGAYNHCIQKVKKDTRWMAIIDIDEFIVPVHYNNLQELLKNYSSAGGLQIFWQFFGTSGVEKIPDNMTLVESLTWKAQKDDALHYNFKTIVQPRAVDEYKVHGGSYKKHWHEIFPHGTRGGAWQPIHIDIVRIHHYWMKDEDYFRNFKVPRREKFEGTTYTEERIQAMINALNQVQDTTILRFVPRLRSRLGL
jgi:hypothetical protein